MAMMPPPAGYPSWLEFLLDDYRTILEGKRRGSPHGSDQDKEIHRKNEAYNLAIEKDLATVCEQVRQEVATAASASLGDPAPISYTVRRIEASVLVPYLQELAATGRRVVCGLRTLERRLPASRGQCGVRHEVFYDFLIAGPPLSPEEQKAEYRRQRDYEYLADMTPIPRTPF
jgi:hypothetical protein